MADLTKEQQAILDELIERFVGYRKMTCDTFDTEKALAMVRLVYRANSYEMPDRVDFMDSRDAALKLGEELTGGAVSLEGLMREDVGWLVQYTFSHAIGEITDAQYADIKIMAEALPHVFDIVALDQACLVVKMPKLIRTDANDELHGEGQPAREWANGDVDYIWHGVRTSKRFVMEAKEVTAQEFLAIRDTEQRRVVGEAAGWGHIVQLLGGKSIDTWTHDVTGLKYELFRCDGGMQFLSKQSPKLQDGSQPTYFEPVHEDLRTAQAARKWQVPTANGWLSVEECERDPKLVYGFET